MNRLNKILILFLSFILLFTITACDLGNQKQETAKLEDSSQNQKITKPIEQEIPDYVMTKEVFKDETGEVYGTVKYDYDEKGNLLQVDYINKQGEVIERKKYKYNQYGLKTKRIVTEAISNRSDYEWRLTSYDRTDLADKRAIKSDRGVYNEGTAEYRYNSNGKLVFYEQKNKKNEKLKQIKIKYYKNGNKKFEYEWKDNIEGKYYYNKKGKIKKAVIESSGYRKVKKNYYNDFGNRVKIEEIKTNEQGKKVEKILRKRKYNNEGRLVKAVMKSNSFIGGTSIKTNFTMEYKYNEKGNLIKTIKRDEDGSIAQVNKFEYDKKGKVIVSIVNDKEHNVVQKTKYNYKYDNKGNLIRVIAKDSNSYIEKNKKYYYKKLK